MSWKKPLILMLVVTASCASAVPIFKWDGPLFATDSRRQELKRGTTICKTNEPCFDALICTPIETPRKNVERCQAIINQCERWKEGTR